MIDQTKVSRSLDKKSLILWLEITDIFLIVTFCTLLNICFSGILKIYFVYTPTIILAITLILTKRGKPENYLNHLIKFYLSPKYLSCFNSGSLNRGKNESSR